MNSTPMLAVDNPPVYPRTYQNSRLARALFLFPSAILVGIGAMLLGLLATDKLPAGALLGFVASCFAIGLIGLGLYFCVYVFQVRVVLFADAIFARGIVRERTLNRSQIRGWRPYGIALIVLVPRANCGPRL